MCVECEKIDKRIARLNQLRRTITDDRALKAVVSLLVEEEDRKDALHPEGFPQPARLMAGQQEQVIREAHQTRSSG